VRALAGPKQEERGKGAGRPGGGKRNGPSPRQGGREGILFHFLNSVSLFLLKQNTFQNKI
jgi:hypothetical protein